MGGGKVNKILLASEVCDKLNLAASPHNLVSPFIFTSNTWNDPIITVGDLIVFDFEYEYIYGEDFDPPQELIDSVAKRCLDNATVSISLQLDLLKGIVI